MTIETKAITLIRTKLQRPRLPGDLILRRRLLDRLHAGSEGKLTLISAMAGTGKTTLLAQWLEECPQPSAWLSLDEHDNDLVVFMSYLIGAIRTVFPGACGKTFELLSAAQTPPLRVLITSLVNELDDLCKDHAHDAPAALGERSPRCVILALDDYHTITEPAIHEILASLIEHLPHGVHLVLATRVDPRLPLAGLRARREMTEVRSADLRFTAEEAHALLEATTGEELSPETIHLLESKTEGWVVGLRLAALSMRARPNDKGLTQGIARMNSDLVVEYLLSEVLTRQSPEIQDFALRTSVLDRFCAPLCQALTGLSVARSQEILEWMRGANLFLVPLDEGGGWYRYHHLFGEFLRSRLRENVGAAEIAGLHVRAGAWFVQNGLIDEGLVHLLAADDTSAAAAVVAQHRYALMNQAQWPRLDRYLRQFQPEVLDQYPDLLMLKTWLLYHRGQWAELPAALQRLEATTAQASLPPEQVRHLQGETSALRGLISYNAFDPDGALAFAKQALESTPRKLWIVRILARLCMAVVLHMRGDSSQAYAAIYRGFEEEETQSDAFKASLVMTSCHIHWLDADLHGMAQAARQCIAFGQRADTPQFTNYGHYHLGRVLYQQNDLPAAESSLATVVQQPYLDYGECFAHSACALALVHQIQGQPHKADAVLESAIAFMLETGNTTLMPLIRSFEAEIALRQGHVAKAGQWAVLVDPIPPFRPVYGFFWLHLTLIKTWLAQDTPSSRNQAADLLDAAREFVETTHNSRFLIEVLALQALVKHMLGERQAALELLEQAVTLAKPGGFIRVFVDLGPPLDRMLERLRCQGVAAEYITRILIAFETKDGADSDIADTRSAPLIAPLTPRELEVLALLDHHLTNKEIAAELVISYGTVKTHTLNIYRKLDVRKRREAVAKAKELNLL
jgi:LuxR family maltose regulon positive regulatory protein